MNQDLELQQFKKKMETSLEVLMKELSGIRTGRASTALLEPIKVEAYGSVMPLNQVGSISAPDPTTLCINVWDREMIKPVEKAIQNSGTNLNPMTEGQIIRISLPPLSNERRQELSKLAAKYAEDARVALRNVRRAGIDHAKQLEKNKEIGEDEMHKFSDKVQEMVDKFIKQVDDALDAKQKDILQI